MNPINLNAGGEIDARRSTGRLLDPERASDALSANTPQATNAASTAPLPSDSVVVSERASAVGDLTAKTSQLPDVRQDRVAELRTRFQNGDYQPSSDDIAAALLRETQNSAGKV